MTEKLLGAAGLFASHYQIVICDEPSRILSDDANWNAEKSAQGFAGVPCFRMIGTEADLNNHWVELFLADEPPEFSDWQRVTCVHFQSLSGRAHVMSVVDTIPVISAEIEVSDYSLYVAGNNLGIDPLSRGESNELSDLQLTTRKDAEWYRIFLVPGVPSREGRLKDT